MKQCSKCKQWKELSEFYRNKSAKDKRRSDCKECTAKQSKKYINENKDKIKKIKKKWRIRNKDKIKQQRKEYRIRNKDKIKEYNEEYEKSNAKYETFKDQLTSDESPKLNKDGISLEVKCRYCGKYFIPTNSYILKRIQALNGSISGERGLYCSDSCKESCPTYGQILYPKGFKKATSREVQPQLRQLVLERDDYTCQYCGSTEYLHCHHIYPLNESPITSADIDECITLCKECHKEVHSIPGCGYSELRCSDL